MKTSEPKPVQCPKCNGRYCHTISSEERTIRWHGKERVTLVHNKQCQNKSCNHIFMWKQPISQ